MSKKQVTLRGQETLEDVPDLRLILIDVLTHDGKEGWMWSIRIGPGKEFPIANSEVYERGQRELAVLEGTLAFHVQRGELEEALRDNLGEP